LEWKEKGGVVFSPSECTAGAAHPEKIVIDATAETKIFLSSSNFIGSILYYCGFNVKFWKKLLACESKTFFNILVFELESIV
jgi:hypothetical protein